ncbi:TetR/AcrR family transcriptional regulator [Frankia sp. ACN1ag]|uniref:TetR/AcrR family transcriptional regulator n=1 Tax=Frankia sp. ACN1ag TaxID=102891 RepID=UPI0006DC826B|nr:helix-turn-helix domain-containing protein [Frankia sp. ACN1ag]KQC36479.1 transcriptional regulator [Frankia sp. ACN1ag]
MSGEHTRRDLLLAAERLFAAGGIDGPSMREISKAAGQLNTSALQYHFGDRQAVLAAIIDRHHRDIETHRLGLLDALELDGEPPGELDGEPAGEPAGEPGLRALAAALVLPQAARLDHHDGGPEYLQIIAEVTARPERFAASFAAASAAPSMVRWRALVTPFLPPAAVGPPLHRRFAAIRFLNGELATRAREHHRPDHRLFASHLVDLVTAILAAPVSAQTSRHIHSGTPSPADR